MRRVALVALAGLVAPAVAAPSAALLQSQYEAELGQQGGNPVTRVVKLLQHMQAELVKEKKADEDMFQKLECWCESNDKEKSDAILAAEQKIASLTSLVEELTAKSASLNNDIKSTKEDLVKSKESLESAKTMRAKEAGEFHGEEKDGVVAVQNLKAAITVLSKHNGAFPQILATASFLSTAEVVGADDFDDNVHYRHDYPTDLLDRQLQSMGDWVKANPEYSGKNLDKKVHTLLRASGAEKMTADGFSESEIKVLMQARKVAMSLAQRSGMPAYQAQSGEIFGVLKQMLTEFQSNLSDAQQKEVAAVEQFNAMRQAKEAEIAASETQLSNYQESLATCDEDLANGKEDLESTSNSLSADQKFLIVVKESCASGNSQFDERVKLRAQEIMAVSQAIKILMSDDARDTMTSTFSFVQISVNHAQQARLRAVALVRAVARKTGDAALAQVAQSISLDGFFKVKKAIDGMITMLKTQQADEVKTKDYCNGALHKNEMESGEAEQHKSDTETTIEALESAVATLHDDIATAKAAVSQMQVDLKRASEDRREGSAEFQRSYSEQAATEAILSKAHAKLQEFYGSFVQKRSSLLQRQEPPAQFGAFKKNAGSSGVLSMIQALIVDARNLQKQSASDEQSAQSAYQQEVHETNSAVAERLVEIVNKQEEVAQKSKAKTEAKSDLQYIEGELLKLSKVNGDLHAECDYVLKNFDIRQTARQQEVEALQEAKSILSGMQ